jgi:hypothetical protein
MWIARRLGCPSPFIPHGPLTDGLDPIHVGRVPAVAPCFALRARGTRDCTDLASRDLLIFGAEDVTNG